MKSYRTLPFFHSLAQSWLLNADQADGPLHTEMVRIKVILSNGKWQFFFLNMGQPRPLLFIFHCKAFYNNDFTNWAFSRNISASMTSCVRFPGLSQLHGRESWVGVTVCLLALQDGEVTIITQTIEDTMSLAKLRRFIRVIWFTMLKVSYRAETETVVK